MRTNHFLLAGENPAALVGHGAIVCDFALEATMEQAEHVYPRVNNIVEIMNRLTNPDPDAVFRSKPLVATAIELDEPGDQGACYPWAIVYGISDHQLQFIHGQSLRGERIALRIAAPDGEIVEIVVATRSSQPIGDLFETSARFLGMGHPDDDTRPAGDRPERKP